MILFLLMFPLATSAYGQSSRVHYPIAPKAHRLPVQKKNITLMGPKNYEKRILRYGSNTGEAVYYDPKPHILAVDPRSGKYALKWIGYDGKEKTVIYQRPDRIEAIVSASVSRTVSGGFLYVYRIDNLPSSGQQLSDFVVQTFTSDARQVKDHPGFVGQMSNNRSMKEGNWIFFGSSYIGSSVTPGRSVELRLESSAPPGLVECRVTGGVFGMKGVGEDIPQELENILPGYEIWPTGYTIGPIDKLRFLSEAERASYITDLLTQFRRLGWITLAASGWYAQNLRAEKLREVFARNDQDFKAGKITSEVHDMIRAIEH